MYHLPFFFFFGWVCLFFQDKVSVTFLKVPLRVSIVIHLLRARKMEMQSGCVQQFTSVGI